MKRKCTGCQGTALMWVNVIISGRGIESIQTGCLFCLDGRLVRSAIRAFWLERRAS